MIYKVNGHADYFSVYQKKVSSDKVTGPAPANGVQKVGDRVEISENAAFRTQLEQVQKESAQQVNAAASQSRLDALKQAYANDNCPVSDQDVADSLLNHFWGRGSL